MRMMIALLAPLLLNACALLSEEYAYCARWGIGPEHPEYGPCIDYFNTQDALFNQDLFACESLADQTYPRALYDDWRYDNLQDPVSIDRYQGGLGSVPSSRTVAIPPDYHKNALLDNLRSRIITPCMAEQGWKSATTWQAGRLTDAERKQKEASAPRGVAAPARSFSPAPVSIPSSPKGPLPWLAPSQN